MINSHINSDSIPWIEKYRPNKLSDMAQNQHLLDFFKNSIASGNLSHYLFYGPPGTGKTSAILAIGREIFKEHFRQRVIEFNASDDRGIKAVRGKITNHAKKTVSEIVCEDGTIIPGYKIIILDEADSMTDEAQDALRVIIEQYSSVTRFCFICNYNSKITDAIKSRCSPVYFKKLDESCMLDKLASIAKAESMELDDNIINAIIDVSCGDMRKAIMMLQNLKYSFKSNEYTTKKINQMSLIELKNIPVISGITMKRKDITVSDIYHMAGSIPIKEAENIVKQVLKCTSIVQVSDISSDIVSSSWPIDAVMLQINNVILNSSKFSDYEKALIINYSGKIVYRTIQCANEQIQITDYLSCIYGVKNNISLYMNI